MPVSTTWLARFFGGGPVEVYCNHIYIYYMYTYRHIYIYVYPLPGKQGIAALRDVD